jgi:flagellin
MVSIQPSSFIPASSPQPSDSQQQLASGKRINSAADDAAGLAIATRLTSNINANQQAQRNAVDAQSLIQTEDGALAGISDGVHRLQELALQQGNGILNESDREALAAEAEQIRSQISDTLSQTQFNGRDLFQRQDQNQESAQDLRFQLGSGEDDAITLSANTLASEVEETLAGLDFTSPDSAADLSSLNELQQSLGARRSELGAVSNRIDASLDNLSQQNETSQAARSRIEDADLAQSVSERLKDQILQQAQISSQTQANASSEQVLRLLD